MIVVLQQRSCLLLFTKLVRSVIVTSQKYLTRLLFSKCSKLIYLSLGDGIILDNFAWCALLVNDWWRMDMFMTLWQNVYFAWLYNFITFLETCGILKTIALLLIWYILFRGMSQLEQMIILIFSNQLGRLSITSKRMFVSDEDFGRAYRGWIFHFRKNLLLVTDSDWFLLVIKFGRSRLHSSIVHLNEIIMNRIVLSI